jgi:hypothetical protein
VATVLALLMCLQSALGLWFPNQYHDADWIRASWFGNDWVTLITAVCLFVSTIRPRPSFGSSRTLLLKLGVIAYAIYNYAYYLFGAALNAFFPLYVALAVLAVATLISEISHVDPERVAACFRPSTRLRLAAVYLSAVGIALTSVWMAMWTAYVFAGRPTPIGPEAFKLIAALDISMLAMPLAVGGWWLWQGRPWGYVVAPVAAIQSSLYLLVLSASSIVSIRRGLVEAPGELPIWNTLAALTIAVTTILLADVRTDREASTTVLAARR